MARIKICKEEGCKDAATTEGFCRLHYLKNWKDLKKQKQEKAAKKLNNYIEHILKNHPEDYMNILRKDLRKFENDGVERFGYEDEENLFGEKGMQEGDIEKIIDRIKIEKDF